MSYPPFFLFVYTNINDISSTNVTYNFFIRDICVVRFIVIHNATIHCIDGVTNYNLFFVNVALELCISQMFNVALELCISQMF